MHLHKNPHKAFLIMLGLYPITEMIVTLGPHGMLFTFMALSQLFQLL